MQNSHYDLIVIGSGAAGMMSAIVAAQNKKRVLLLEQLSSLGAKLKATGGGRCNLSNTLKNDEFMQRFGKNGRFMTQALNAFDHNDLMHFFQELGVKTHIPDGFRIFPITHSSATILDALTNELQALHVELLTSTKADELIIKESELVGVKTAKGDFYAKNVVVATGGLGYESLGATGDGYRFASSAGHKISKLHPAMMPLHTKEKHFSACRADTIAHAIIRINHKKAKKIKAVGDLIFTKEGIRGPVVLDFAREITPLLDEYGKVEILVNMTKELNENEILNFFKENSIKNPQESVLEHLSRLLPQCVAEQLCHLSGADTDTKFSKLEGKTRDTIIKNIAWTPLTVTGHDGFSKAMITRGGVSLKEIDPNTMQSKILKGLYFCGEVVDLDGPCGGYNLQWSFSSGYLAGMLKG